MPLSNAALGGLYPARDRLAALAAAVVPERREWGIASYQTFMFGLVLVLLAIVIVWTARVKRPISYLIGLSGLAWLVLGWVLGAEGFAPIAAVPSDAAQAFLFAGSTWLAHRRLAEEGVGPSRSRIGYPPANPSESMVSLSCEHMSFRVSLFKAHEQGVFTPQEGVLMSSVTLSRASGLALLLGAVLVIEGGIL